ncbi:MAG: hypothetical protein EOO01_21165, partial [Chitinophagaceae bacterium]
MKKTVFLFIMLTLVLFAQAQTIVKGKISFNVINQQSLPVENATAELLRLKDSSLVRTAITGKGSTEFEQINLGEYIIIFI